MRGNVERRITLGRIALVSGAVLVAWAGYFGADQEPKPVNAGDNTLTPTAAPIPTAAPTPTAARPTATSTPDIWDARIATAYPTLTALAKQEELAKLEVTMTAVSKRINILHGTPTETSTPTATGTATSTPTVTPTWTREQIRIKQEAGLLPTDTPTPRPTPTYAVPKESAGSGGGLVIPWGGIPWDRVLEATGILGGLGALYGFRTRIPLVRRIGNRIPGPHF